MILGLLHSSMNNFRAYWWYQHRQAHEWAEETVQVRLIPPAFFHIINAVVCFNQRNMLVVDEKEVPWFPRYEENPHYFSGCIDVLFVISYYDNCLKAYLRAGQNCKQNIGCRLMQVFYIGYFHWVVFVNPFSYSVSGADLEADHPGFNDPGKCDNAENTSTTFSCHLLIIYHLSLFLLSSGSVSQAQRRVGEAGAVLSPRVTYSLHLIHTRRNPHMVRISNIFSCWWPWKCPFNVG